MGPHAVFPRSLGATWIAWSASLCITEVWVYNEGLAWASRSAETGAWSADADDMSHEMDNVSLSSSYCQNDHVKVKTGR